MTVALRTQQICAYETGVTSVVDPLGGSYLVEKLTSELEAEAAEPREMEPEQFRSFIREEVKKWSDVAKNAGIRVN